MCFVERAYNRNMFHWCWNYISQTDYIQPFAGKELYKCNMIKVMINMKENLRGHIQYLCTSIKQKKKKGKYALLYSTVSCFLNVRKHIPVWHTVFECLFGSLTVVIQLLIFFFLKHCLRKVKNNVSKDTLLDIKDHVEFDTQKRL